MNIILAEVRPDGELLPEVSFSKGYVLIGRDANECDIVFESEKYPMVSRRHAEIAVQNGKWYVTDLNSSFGTLLNGEQVSGTTVLPVGSRVQFGKDGPQVKVVWYEALSDSAYGVTPPEEIRPPVESPSPAYPVTSVRTPAPAEPQTPAPATPVMGEAYLEFVGGQTRPPVKLAGSAWLGRDPACEVFFDASAATVSRRHANIRFESGDYLLTDNNSFNGTLINGQRISAPIPLYNNDEFQLGLGGPVVRFISPERAAPVGSSLAGARMPGAAPLPAEDAIGSKTMVFKLDAARSARQQLDSAEPQLLRSVGFADRNSLTIGRDASNDIALDGLQISKRHARLFRSGSEIFVEDLNSTNGVFINGSRVTRQVITPQDSVQIGSFLIRVDGSGNIGVFDTRAKMRIDAVNITRDVSGRMGGGKIRLLDGISLSIRPNEFVGLLGPSGAGKSTLMEALCGSRPATDGNVLINNLDLYRHFDSLKQAIGFVPQDDIIHKELSVYRTLFYVAKLRLSRDVSSAEIAKMIDEVLDVTGLSDRRDIPVHKLSGGQRKRVSVAVELVTKPSVLFLDEPTSGLDPATEDKMMRLFKQIAESGRTVVITTHAMENVKLFDKIAVLMKGKLVFFGEPEDALTHLGAKNYKDLYEKLEASVDAEVEKSGGVQNAGVAERAAEEWRQRFHRSPQYKELVQKPLGELGQLQPGGLKKKRRLGIFGSIRQWLTLSRRYAEVLIKDRLSLLILLAQAPIIAFLTFLVMGAEQPRDFVYFVLALVAVWFGTSVSAREIVRERPIYRRERMFNLGIVPYIASKLFILGLIVTVQCLFLFVPLKLFDQVGLMSMPGELFGIPQLWAMLLTAGVGVALGLLVSALVKTPERATGLVPLILIPQILFSGLVGVPSGLNKVVGLTMPSAWSFDTMKRFSTLDTLEPEGAQHRGPTRGLGLYRYIESENERTLSRAQKDLEDFKKMSAAQVGGGGADSENPLADRLVLPELKKIPDDLSGYVTFLHPWMHEVLNQLVLMVMFGLLSFFTLVVVRLKDSG